MIMEQHTIYKCYYSYKCWICAELCEAFIFLMENIYTYVQFEGMIYQQIVVIPMGTNCAPLIADLLSSRNSVGGFTVFDQSLSNFTCKLWMMRGGTLLILGHGIKGQSQLWHSVYKTMWTRYRLQI